MIEICMLPSKRRKNCSRRCKHRLSRNKKKSRIIWLNYIATKPELSNQNTNPCKSISKTQQKQSIITKRANHIKQIRLTTNRATQIAAKITVKLTRDRHKYAIIHTNREYPTKSGLWSKMISLITGLKRAKPARAATQATFNLAALIFLQDLKNTQSLSPETTQSINSHMTIQADLKWSKESLMTWEECMRLT